MSKGSLLCSLLLLQVCILRLSLISCSQLNGGRIGDNLLCQDPIWRSWLMSSHGRNEFDGHSADSIFDEELEELSDEGVDTDRVYVSDYGGICIAGEDDLLPVHGGDGSSASGGDVQCLECGKFFKNDKSMFGHLRSHPNRGYKGAIPPAKKLELLTETAAISTSSSTPGSNQRSAQNNGRDPRLTPLEILCVYGILTLKYRDNNHEKEQAPLLPQPSFGNSDEVLPPPQPSFGKVDVIGQAEGGICGSVASNATAEFKCNNAGAEAGNCGGHVSFIAKIPKKRRKMPTEVGEAHRKKVKLASTPKEKRPYICKHCKAEFSTHQALGGHMAGHHREKKVPALNDSSFRAHQGMAAESQNRKQGMAADSQNWEQQVRDGGEENQWRGNNLSVQNDLLPKQFSMALDLPWQSGQSSRGQMRKHSERRKDGLSPAAVASPTHIDDVDGRRLLNIDLNVEVQEHE